MPPTDAAPLALTLSEWQQAGPATHPILRDRRLTDDPALRRGAEALRGRIEVRRSFDGLEVASTSFVGWADLGPLRIAVRPKLDAMPLSCLLRYAYGLRDLVPDEPTAMPAERHGLHDLLIALLAAEIEELLHRGVPRRYVAREAELEAPRGRVLLDSFVRRGGSHTAHLPCAFVERRLDWQLNRVLRSGLELGAALTGDRPLRRRLQRLAAMFGEVASLTRLELADIDAAHQALTRLDAQCGPALVIIRLLHEMLGTGFEGEALHRMPAFLFDMNRFFQRLLARLLREIPAPGTVEDERMMRDVFAYAADGNPRRRTPPRPRPDYAWIEDLIPRLFLDAKYRDVWERGLPAEWLYQLSIYALGVPAQTSVLLYACMSDAAEDERIEVRPPGRGADAATVIIRPVRLRSLAALIEHGHRGSRAIERRAFAAGLVRDGAGFP